MAGRKKKFEVRIQITASAYFYAPVFFCAPISKMAPRSTETTTLLFPFFRHDFFFRAITRRRRFLHKAAYFSRPPSILEHHPKIGIGATKKAQKSKLRLVALAPAPKGATRYCKDQQKCRKNIFPSSAMEGNQLLVFLLQQQKV